FIKILDEREKEISQFRNEIVQKYGKKDKNGDLVIEDNQYILEDPVTFNKEMNELMSEEFIIDETESNKELLTHIRTILESSKQTFKGTDAFLYDQWCEAFENMKNEEQSPKE
ncbi:MAG: DUF1617 family protein, partial [Bacillaceae bacterium]|nr:DUF1617 family protein [Bacillaceae bacterium]